MLRHSCAAAALLLLASLPSAHAQEAVSGELGSNRLRQVGLPETTLITAGTGFSSTLDRVVYAGDFLGGRGVDGVETARAVGSIDVYSEALGRSGFEASMLASVFDATGQTPSTSFELALKQIHQGFRRGGYWSISSGARIWEAQPFPTATGEIGGWADRSTGSYSGTLRVMVATPDRLSPERFGYVEAADALAAWHKTLGAEMLSLSGGVRFGFGNLTDRPAWVEGSVTHPVTSRVALILSSGKTPADFLLGIPATRYASITLKTTLVSRPPTPSPRPN